MGRQQFSQPINVVSQTGISVQQLSSSSSVSLAAGAVDTLYVYAPTKSVGRVRSIFHMFPAIVASTGTKDIEVGINNYGVAKVTGNGTADVGINMAAPQSATSTVPTDLAGFTVALSYVSCTDTMPATFRFRNNTDTATTASRSVVAVMEVQSVS